MAKVFKPVKDKVVKNEHNLQELHKLAVETAAKSTAVKRKVGAIIVDALGNVQGVGYNHNMANPQGPCEDAHGNTLDNVIHAEAAAIADMKIREGSPIGPLTMYVTHDPCDGCLAATRAANIATVKVVGEFLKFDTNKLRFDLVPPSAFKALAKVLTYGAKKYKPHNWRTNEDPDRYVAALYRHLEAWRDGEVNDAESGCTHLEHALTNLAFLIELGYNPKTWVPTKRAK